MNIYQKLVEVRKVVPYLQKENAGGQYKYVSSSQVLSNCKSKMDELGLILEPEVSGHKVTESIIEIKDNNGNVTKRTTTYFTELDMTMTWVNAEKPDEKIAKKWYGQGVDIAGEKGVGKALTYAEKYFMLKYLNIATDKDDPDSFQDKINGDSMHSETEKSKDNINKLKDSRCIKTTPPTIEIPKTNSTTPQNDANSQPTELEKRATTIYFKCTGNKQGQLEWTKEQYKQWLKELKESGVITTDYGKKWTAEDIEYIETQIEEFSGLPF